MHTDKSLYRNHLRIPVRFSDLDAMGHLNNATYLTYFEEGRAHWFRECMHLEEGSLDYPVIVARIEIDYLAPVPFGKYVKIYSRCARIGGKSLRIEGQIVVEGPEPEIVAAKYVCTVVYYDYKTGMTIPVPEDDRRTIVAFEPGLKP